MNKINIEFLDCPPLMLECRMLNINPIWKKIYLNSFFWRMYYHFSGGAGVYLNELRYELRPGYLYLLPPNCNLRTWCDHDVVQLYCHFEIPRIAGNPEFALNPIAISEETLQKIEQFGEMLKVNSPVRKLLQGTALIADALNALPDEALLPRSVDGRISQICEWMKNYPDRDFDLAELASRVEMAPNSFLRRFREVTGNTPLQYLLDIRYSKAERLLLSGSYTIDQICECVGITDRFHFSREFKKRYGISPGRYRSAASLDLIHAGADI